MPGCTEVRHKGSDTFCLEHLTVYVLGNMETFGKPGEVVLKIQKFKHVKDAWLQAEKRLADNGGKLEALSQGVHENEKYYVRVVEKWRGYKKSDVDTRNCTLL